MTKVLKNVWAVAVLLFILGTSRTQAQSSVSVFVDEVHGQANTYVVTAKPVDPQMATWMNQMTQGTGAIFSSVQFQANSGNFTVVTINATTRENVVTAVTNHFQAASGNTGRANPHTDTH